LYFLQRYASGLQSFRRRVPEPAWATDKYISISSGLNPVLSGDPAVMKRNLLVLSLSYIQLEVIFMREYINPDSNI
jgi:hypothetical protein